MQHTKTPWRIGTSCGAIVADEPVPEISGTDSVKYYGGHLIAESIAPRNATFIVRACNAYYKLIEALELADGIMSFSRGDAYERDCTRGDYDKFQAIYRKLFSDLDPQPALASQDRMSWGAERRAPCPHCGKKYGAITGIKAHIKSKHSDLKAGAA